MHSAIGSLLHWRSDQDRRAGARRLAAAGECADARLIGPEGDSVADLDQPLTPRESEVLLLLAKGASNKLIARRLGISVHTAKFHVGQLLDKLDATGRTDAVAHAAAWACWISPRPT